MAMISFDSVVVEFPIYQLSARSFKKQLLRFSTGSKLQKTEDQKVIVRALDKLSFHIRDGDRVGLLGHNGAGKSTLLRTMAKIYEPIAGDIAIDGKVSPLLDMSCGINPESTGFENILIRGILLGLTRAEIKAKALDIAHFTELGGYLDIPMRTYSSGMQLRLAFGVATAIQPEILLLDEIFGAGDASFQQKAKERIYDLIDKSRVVVLSSHALPLIKTLCNKVMILHAGALQFFGDVREGLERYTQGN